MKNVVLSALLLAAALATSAQAVTPPAANQTYKCYYDNYSGLASDPGYSSWALTGSPTFLLRGNETFTTSYGTDAFKTAWAYKNEVPYGSNYEFTFNPSGPQCTQTHVLYNGVVIQFRSCSDGHIRDCYLYW
jgi:hypothetical protein